MFQFETVHFLVSYLSFNFFLL